MPRPTTVTLASIVDRRDRACIDVDSRVFHPRKISGAVEHAKQICRTCPVIHDCLAYATAHDLDGIWAATTREERRPQHGSSDRAPLKQGRATPPEQQPAPGTKREPPEP